MLDVVITNLISQFGFEAVRELFVSSHPKYMVKIYKAYNCSCKVFDKLHSSEYGPSMDNFLSSEEEFNKFIKGFDFNKSIVQNRDISGKSLDAKLKEVPQLVINEFIEIFLNECNKDHELHNRISHAKIITMLSGNKKDLSFVLDHLGSYQRHRSPSYKKLTIIPSLPLAGIIGRERDLDGIKTNLDLEGSLLINGIAGVGKTSLANAFIQKYLNEYDHMIWISVTFSLKEAVLADAVLIENLGLSENFAKMIKTKDSEDAFKIIINRLKTAEGNNIIVIDNIEAKDEPEIEIIRSLLNDNWKIILTSKEHLTNCKEYFLNVLSKQKAIELFKKLYKGKTIDNDLGNLLKSIGYHTLSIELLANVAHQNPNLTVKEILHYLERHQLNNKRLAIKIKISHGGEKEVEAYSHLLSIVDLSKLNKKEQDLLLQFSLLPSKEMSLAFLFRLFKIDINKQTDFINNLNSIIKKGYLSPSYKLHPIIQEIIKYKLEIKPDEFIQIISSIYELINYNQEKDNPIERLPYLDFGTSIIKTLDTVESTNKASIAFMKKYNSLKIAVSRNYILIGRYSDAAQLIESELNNKKQYFEEDLAGIAISQSDLAYVYGQLGRNKEEIDLLENVLITDLIILGSNNIDTAITRANLGTAYSHIGKYKEAVDLLKIALQTFKNQFRDNPLIGVVQCNLAGIYFELGMYKRAKNLFEQSLSSDIKNYGKNHPHVAITKASLANVYHELDEYEKAAELFDQALVSNLENFGEDHPIIAQNKSSLAGVYSDLRMHQKAMELQKQALKQDLSAFGEHHPNVARDRSNLAIFYTCLKKYGKAIKLFRTALKSDIKTFGENHERVSNIYSNLSDVYFSLGKFKQAGKLMEKAVDLSTRNFGYAHPAVAKREAKLAIIYMSQGKHQESVELLEQALRNEIRIFGNDHTSVLRMRTNLADAYSNLGVYAKAIKTYKDSLKSARRSFEKNQVLIAVTQSNLAYLYMKMMKYERALTLLESSYIIFQKYYGEKHDATIAIQKNLDFLKRKYLA